MKFYIFLILAHLGLCICPSLGSLSDGNAWDNDGQGISLSSQTTNSLNWNLQETVYLMVKEVSVLKWKEEKQLVAVFGIEDMLKVKGMLENGNVDYIDIQGKTKQQSALTDLCKSMSFPYPFVLKGIDVSSWGTCMAIKVNVEWTNNHLTWSTFTFSEKLGLFATKGPAISQLVSEVYQRPWITHLHILGALYDSEQEFIRLTEYLKSPKNKLQSVKIHIYDGRHQVSKRAMEKLLYAFKSDHFKPNRVEIMCSSPQCASNLVNIVQAIHHKVKSFGAYVHADAPKEFYSAIVDPKSTITSLSLEGNYNDEELMKALKSTDNKITLFKIKNSGIKKFKTIKSILENPNNKLETLILDELFIKHDGDMDVLKHKNCKLKYFSLKGIVGDDIIKEVEETKHMLVHEKFS